MLAGGIKLLRGLCHQIRRAERWVAYRTYDKTTVVNTKLPPAYYDKDQIFLHASFSVLVDFVEIELASIDETLALRTNKNGRIRNCVKLIKRMFSRSRSPERGLNYLTLQLKSEAAELPEVRGVWRDIKALYEWWTLFRPNRQDPEEVVGLTAFMDEMISKYGGIYHPVQRKGYTVEMTSPLNSQEQMRLKSLSLKAVTLQQFYDDQDQLMLVKLCSVRGHLWI